MSSTINRSPTAVVRSISPAEAAALMEGRGKNRSISQPRVASYARDMAAGRWQLNGQSIVIDSSGRLVDGQHRLSACIMAGVPFVTAVITGVEADAIITIDSNRPRSVSDFMTIDGRQHATATAATLRALVQYSRWDTGSASTSFSPSHQELMLLHKRHAGRGLDDSVAAVYNPSNCQVGTYAQRAAVNFGIRFAHGARLAEQWEEGLVSGADLSHGDPRLSLRSRLIADRASQTNKMSKVYALAITIKAANAFIAGSDITVLRFGSAERLPVLSGFPPSAVWGDARPSLDVTSVD